MGYSATLNRFLDDCIDKVGVIETHCVYMQEAEVYFFDTQGVDHFECGSRLASSGHS